QLVSLEFCRVCRSIPTSHVRVNQETPLGLWHPWKSNTTPTNYAAEVRISGRVPVVSAFGLKWSLSMEVLQQSSAIELLSSLELQLADFSSEGSLVGVLASRAQMVCSLIWIAVDMVSWPASLQTLRFGHSFNKSITGVVWPASL
ncbi:unnamed protein product, partial [Ectocarpus sp. 4 AP-2014]